MKPHDFCVSTDYTGKVVISVVDGTNISGHFFDCYKYSVLGSLKESFAPCRVGGSEKPAKHLSVEVLFPAAVSINHGGETGLFRLVYGWSAIGGFSATLDPQSQTAIDKACVQAGWADELRRVADCSKQDTLACIQSLSRWRVVAVRLYDPYVDVSELVSKVMGCPYTEDGIHYNGNLADDLEETVSAFGHMIFTRNVKV